MLEIKIFITNNYTTLLSFYIPANTAVILKPSQGECRNVSQTAAESHSTGMVLKGKNHLVYIHHKGTMVVNTRNNIQLISKERIIHTHGLCT